MSTPEQPTPAGATSSFDHWRTSPDFQMEREFIRFLGRTGEFRRQPALDMFAQHYYGPPSAAPFGRRLAEMLGRLIQERRFVL